MSRMINEGARLLYYGLYAKSVYYQNYDCSTLMSNVVFKDKVCGKNKLDLTLNSTIGMTWVEAALAINNFNSEAFKYLKNNIPAKESDLSSFLWDQ